MPRETKAFACEFGCRRRVLVSRKSMEKHEQTCASNPARRACRTCKHQIIEAYESDTGAGGCWCAEDQLPNGATMAVNCPYWASK